ncbi:MAG: Flp family type IVb pilin [Alphaproteobacteria bacterium]
MQKLKAVLGFVSALRSSRGATAMEYGLIAALIAATMIVAVTAVQTGLQLTFNMIAGQLGSSPH